MENLPVELVATIFSALDLMTLVTLSQLSRRLRYIVSDRVLNAWKQPLIRFLKSRGELYEDPFSHLGRLQIFPEHNWVHILSIAELEYLLLRCSIPPLSSSIFEDSFRRRFLPSWTTLKAGVEWREHFLRTCFRVWHRGRYPCSVEENWTKYIVFYHNGSIKRLETASRSFNPIAMFEQLKHQDNLVHLPTRVRVVLQLCDVRILALGMLSRTASTFRINHTAQSFLRPPSDIVERDPDEYLDNTNFITHPTPALCHANYPHPSSEDWRWNEPIDDGFKWVGSFLITAQIVDSHKAAKATPDDLSLGRPGRAQFVSFTWTDLQTIAPWMSHVVTSQASIQEDLEL